MRLFVTILIAFFAALPSGRAEKVVSDGCVGSASEEILEKAIVYIGDKDFVAVKKLFDAGLLIRLEGGLDVQIMDYDSYMGIPLVKIRPRGEILEVWVASSKVESR